MNSKVKYIVAQPLCGGMPLGFEKSFGCAPEAIITAGFTNDTHYIKYMNETHGKNIPIINMNGGYTEFLDEESEKLYNKHCQNVDVLMHVAVCAGLSQLNACNSETSTKRRGDPDNDQNQNMYALTRLGMKMNAKVVVFENAPAAYTNSGKATVDRLVDIAKEHGYSTQLFKTDTLLHGIPQSRKRTFIMFYRDGNPGLFNYEHKEYVSLDEYLAQCSSDMLHGDLYLSEDSKDLFYEFVLDHTGEKTFHDAMMKLAPDKSSATSLYLTQVIGFDVGAKYFSNRYDVTGNEKYLKAVKVCEHCKNKIGMGKGYWDGSTYVANHGKYVNAVISKNILRSLHPTEERGLTVREILWLMGHPHDFELIDPKRSWVHISQNVPVTTAAFIASQIKLYLEGNLSIATTDFVKQDNIKQRLDTPSGIESTDW